MLIFFSLTTYYINQMELNTNILLSIQSTQPAEQIFFLMYYLLTIQQMYFRRRNNTVAKISRVLANVPTMCYGNCLLLWNWCPFVFFFGSGGREGEADEQCQRSHEGQQSPRRTVGGWGAGSPDPAQGLPLSKRRGRVLVKTKTKQKTECKECCISDSDAVKVWCRKTGRSSTRRDEGSFGKCLSFDVCH